MGAYFGIAIYKCIYSNINSWDLDLNSGQAIHSNTIYNVYRWYLYIYVYIDIHLIIAMEIQFNRNILDIMMEYEWNNYACRSCK